MDREQQDVERRQQALLDEMARIRVMRRGTLSQQRYPQRQAQRGGHGACGPYFVWQGYVRGKRFGRRVNAQEAETIQSQIAARHRFEELCAEYVALGEARAERQHQADVADEALKRGLKSRSSKARRSHG